MKSKPSADSASALNSAISPQTEPHFGLSDEEFKTWLSSELENVPGRNIYSDVYEASITAIVNWRKRFRGNPKVWKRIFTKQRVVKELVESAPIIQSVKALVDANSEDEKFTIVDLCCGKGYLSMFLSEILPPEKVHKLILIDKSWAIASPATKKILPHHMNWDHIYGKIPDSDETYFPTWPIPLFTSKQDLKQSCNQRQIKQHIFNKAEGPVIILAIHLCGTLSLKAVEMFNNNENVKFFALKPCCLPGMVYATRGDTFSIGQHEFDAKEVCTNGKFNKKQWNGPPRWHLEPKFDLWVEHLFKGIDVGQMATDESTLSEGKSRIVYASEDGSKVKHEIKIQVEGGFQNTYMFAERTPLISELWENTR